MIPSHQANTNITNFQENILSLQMRLTVYRVDTEDDIDYDMGRVVTCERTLSPIMNSNVNYSNFGGLGHRFIDASDLNRSLRYLPATPYPNALVSDLPRPESPTLHRFATTRFPASQNSVVENGYGRVTATDDDTVVEDEDFDMTSGSRRPSELDGACEDPLPAGQQFIDSGFVCSCARSSHEMPPAPHPNYILVRDNARFPRFPSVNDLLNPALPLAQSSGQGQPLNSNLPSRPNPHPVNMDRNHQPLQQLATPSISPAPSSWVSATSSSAVYPPFSIPEERYFLLNTLHHTCLSASSTYVSSLLPTSRRAGRHSIQFSRHDGRGDRYHPYSPSRGARPAHGRSNARTTSATLMDNISTICTHLWRKARNDGMAPHREEAGAVKVMRDLYKWGEIVVRGVEGAEGEHEEEGSLLSAILGNGLDGGDGRVRVAEAAKKLCAWLRDGQAWGVCEGVLGELKALMAREKEVAGERGSLSLDSEDGLGSIL